MLHYVICIYAHVRSYGCMFLAAGKTIGHRLRRIMGNGKRLHLHISDCKRLIGTDHMIQPWVNSTQTFHAFHTGNGPACGIDRKSVSACQHSGPLYMVRKPLNILSLHLKFAQARLQTLSADPRIHQQMRALTAGIDTVPAAPAGNTA